MTTYLPYRSLLTLLMLGTLYLFPTIVHAQEPNADTDCPPQSNNIWVLLNNPDAKLTSLASTIPYPLIY